MSGAPILNVKDLKKHFQVRRGLLQRTVAEIKAVDGVSFALAAGETLCLVGESGCGKSTVGRLILRLIDPTSGDIVFKGENITNLSREAMRDKRQRLQIVFQDPYASLNPRLTAGTIVGEPLENFVRLGRVEREGRVRALLARVGLGADALHKYPFEFSGGQRQRLGIARALALSPVAHRRRRTGLRPRCFRASTGLEPDDGPAGGTGSCLSIHQPRPWRRRAHGRPRRRHVSRAHR